MIIYYDICKPWTHGANCRICVWICMLSLYLHIFSVVFPSLHVTCSHGWCCVDTFVCVCPYLCVIFCVVLVPSYRLCCLSFPVLEFFFIGGRFEQIIRLSSNTMPSYSCSTHHQIDTCFNISFVKYLYACISFETHNQLKI